MQLGERVERDMDASDRYQMVKRIDQQRLKSKD